MIEKNWRARGDVKKQGVERKAVRYIPLKNESEIDIMKMNGVTTAIRRRIGSI